MSEGNRSAQQRPALPPPRGPFGGMAGPPISGTMMEAIGVQGLPLALGLLCLGLAAFAIWRRRPPDSRPS